jgi:hypothetical protein
MARPRPESRPRRTVPFVTVVAAVVAVQVAIIGVFVAFVLDAPL